MKRATRQTAAALAALASLAGAGQAWAQADAPATTPAPAAAAEGTARPSGKDTGPSICDAPWFRSGSRVQMEGDGALPMSITMALNDAVRSPTGCRAELEITSKSAMSALMGPPVIMQQVHVINIDRTSGKPATIESQHAIINARGKYARMFGEAAFKGMGLFNYAGIPIREGETLPGQAFESSLSLDIYPLSRDEAVGKMETSRASVTVSSRHVGRRQLIDTAMGKKECLPITYEKRTSLGALTVGGELVPLEPTLMHVTDWYCPDVAFVLRTDVRQEGKTQRIDVTSMERDTDMP